MPQTFCSYFRPLHIYKSRYLLSDSAKCLVQSNGRFDTTWPGCTEWTAFQASSGLKSRTSELLQQDIPNWFLLSAAMESKGYLKNRLSKSVTLSTVIFVCLIPSCKTCPAVDGMWAVGAPLSCPALLFSCGIHSVPPKFRKDLMCYWMSYCTPRGYTQKHHIFIEHTTIIVSFRFCCIYWKTFVIEPRRRFLREYSNR